MKVRAKNNLDMLKCIAIILVVMGHITILYCSGGSLSYNPYMSMITDIIYLFHMPLFIAISGYVYGVCIEKGKYHKFVPFIANKFNRLIIPFLFVALLCLYPIMVYLGKTELNITTLCNNIFLGLDCRHLWYLLSLFEMYIVVWLFPNKLLLDKYYIPLVLSIIFAATYGILGGTQLFCLNMSIFFLPFFLLGIRLIHWEYSIKRTVIACLLLGIALAIGIKVSSNPYLDNAMNICLKGLMVICIFSISKKIPVDNFFKISIMNLLHKNSYGIYLFHVPIIYIYVYYLDMFPYWCLVPIAFATAIIVPILLCNLMRKIGLQKIIGE